MRYKLLEKRYFLTDQGRKRKEIGLDASSDRVRVKWFLLYTCARCYSIDCSEATDSGARARRRRALPSSLPSPRMRDTKKNGATRRGVGDVARRVANQRERKETEIEKARDSR